MKPTGIVRKVDELGRIVIPKEIRKVFDIKEKDALEIYTDDNTIILKKYEPFCIFCGSSDNLITHHGKNICKKCANSVTKLVELNG